jgi:hypothetical protein
MNRPVDEITLQFVAEGRRLRALQRGSQRFAPDSRAKLFRSDTMRCQKRRGRVFEGLEEPFANGQDRDQEAVEMAKVEKFLFTRAKSDFHMTPEESEKLPRRC